MKGKLVSKTIQDKNVTLVVQTDEGTIETLAAAFTPEEEVIAKIQSIPEGTNIETKTMTSKKGREILQGIILEGETFAAKPAFKKAGSFDNAGARVGGLSHDAVTLTTAILAHGATEVAAALRQSQAMALNNYNAIAALDKNGNNTTANETTVVEAVYPK